MGGAGSGGTYSGIVKYLKEQDPSVQGVLADPVGSTMGGGEHSDYDIEGIGNDFIPDTMDISLVDQVIKITDTEAFAILRYEKGKVTVERLCHLNNRGKKKCHGQMKDFCGLSTYFRALPAGSALK